MYQDRQLQSGKMTNGTPDIDNLKSISRLFGVSVDSLIENINDTVVTIIREEIDLDKYQKKGILVSRCDAAVKDKYSNATAIYVLVRKKKMNAAESIIDFIVQPGVIQAADSLSDTSSYYLVEMGVKQLLVNVTKTFIEGKELNFKFEGKKCVIGKNTFIRGPRIL